MSDKTNLKEMVTYDRKVLFADFSVLKFNAVLQWLKKDSIYGEAVSDPPKMLERLAAETFDVIVVNLLLGGTGPFEMISNIRKLSKNTEIKVIVVSRQVHRLNIQNTIKAGANDFIAEPFENESLYQRVLYHLTPKKVIENVSFDGKSVEPAVTLTGAAGPFFNLFLECSEVLSRAERNQEHSTFLKILRSVAELLGSNRTSLIIVEEETNTGIVLASSDDPNFYDFPIALHKYPEILHVLHTGNFVLVEDVSRNALTHKINEKVRSIQIGSIMVFPPQ